jgi:hypothetical protein
MASSPNIKVAEIKSMRWRHHSGDEKLAEHSQNYNYILSRLRCFWPRGIEYPDTHTTKYGVCHKVETQILYFVLDISGLIRV